VAGMFGRGHRSPHGGWERGERERERERERGSGQGPNLPFKGTPAMTFTSIEPHLHHFPIAPWAGDQDFDACPFGNISDPNHKSAFKQ
jgi:hypothetical protein